MNAYRVLLIHFSQKQHAIPIKDLVTPSNSLPITEEERNVSKHTTDKDMRQIFEDEGTPCVGNDRVIAAFDLMTLDFSRLNHYPAMLPALTWLYNHIED